MMKVIKDYAPSLVMIEGLVSGIALGSKSVQDACASALGLFLTLFLIIAFLDVRRFFRDRRQRKLAR